MKMTSDFGQAEKKCVILLAYYSCSWWGRCSVLPWSACVV